MIRTLLAFTLVTLLTGCAALEGWGPAEGETAPVYYDPEEWVEVCTGNNRKNVDCRMVKREEIQRQLRRVFRL